MIDLPDTVELQMGTLKRTKDGRFYELLIKNQDIDGNFGNDSIVVGPSGLLYEENSESNSWGLSVKDLKRITQLSEQLSAAYKTEPEGISQYGRDIEWKIWGQ